MASIGQGRSASAAHGARYDAYAEQKKDASEVYRQNLDGTSRRETNREFKERRELHGREIKNPDLLIEFAPDLTSYRSEGAEPDWQSLSVELLQRLAAKMHTHTGKPVDWHDLQGRFIMHTKMNKSKIPHLHGRFNRILSNGEVIADRHIGLLVKGVCAEMDKAHGYKTAEEVGKQLKADTKDRAQNALKEAAKRQKRGSFSLDRYADFCRLYGLILTESRTSTGKLSGYYLQLDENYDGEYHTKYKASDIDRNLTISRIGRTFDKYVSQYEKEDREERERQRRAEEQARKAAEAEKKKQEEQTKKQEEKKNGEQQKPRWHRRFGR